MYKQLYFYLFNRVTDAVKMLQEGNSGEALQTLVNAQKESEEAFVDFSENEYIIAIMSSSIL